MHFSAIVVGIQFWKALSQGVPIIGWPLGGKQCFNSQMLENEVGVCIEVARGVDSGPNMTRLQG